MKKHASELETGDIVLRTRDHAIAVVGETEVAFSSVRCDGTIESYKIPREFFADADINFVLLGPVVDVSELKAYKFDAGDGCEEYYFSEHDIAGKCISGDVAIELTSKEVSE